MTKLEVKPLEWKDLSFFWSCLQANNEYNFIFRVKTKEELQRWFVKDYTDYTKKTRKESIANSKAENPNSSWIPSKQINQWLIFYYERKKIGASNFRGDEDDCEVQILMSARWKNKGLGKLFLFLSEIYIKKNHKNIDLVYANIKSDNIASQKIFVSNGYKNEMHLDYYKYFKN